MDIYAYIPFILFFACEVLLLLALYRYLLRGWIIEHWEDKIREDEGNWLIDILNPAITRITDNILESAPDAVISILKHELLANTGNLTRISKANPDNPEEAGLEMAEMVLKEMGIKKPGVVMTLRLGQQLLNLYNNKKGQETQGSVLPIGEEVI